MSSSPDPFPVVRILDENGDEITEGLFRHGVVLVPVRAWGEAMQFQVDFNPATKKVSFDGQTVPETLTFLGGHGYLPVLSLATAAGFVVTDTHLTGTDKTVTLGQP